MIFFLWMEGRTLDRLAMFVVHLPGLSLAGGERVLAIATQRKTESFGHNNRHLQIYISREKGEHFQRNYCLFFWYFFPSFSGDRFVRAWVICLLQRKKLMSLLKDRERTRSLSLSKRFWVESRPWLGALRTHQSQRKRNWNYFGEVWSHECALWICNCGLWSSKLQQSAVFILRYVSSLTCIHVCVSLSLSLFHRACDL